MTTTKCDVERYYLREKVAGGWEKYTAISVLDPGVRIERSAPKPTTKRDGTQEKSEEHYRISLNFKLQVTMSKFDQQIDYYQRIFDSISLRYVFHRGEWHYVKPRGDPPAKLNVTDETSNTMSMNAGVENLGPTPAGRVEAHVEVNDKISYQGKMTSWREGLSYEPYDPGKPACATQDTWGLCTPPNRRRPHHFHVTSGHASDCKYCPKHHPKGCILEDTFHGHHRYDTAAHWEWEVNLKVSHWAPEIYQCFTRRVTVIRFVPVSQLERATKEQRRRCLHFDFEVAAAVRELGHGWKNLKKYIPMIQDPVEVRARVDKGVRLPTDRARFCVSRIEKLAKKDPRDRRQYATDKDGKDALGQANQANHSCSQAPINIYISARSPQW
ncbi:hypothetical protein OQA88_10459 [Cercophora sp. LCS_1]